jgi:hypothetical protein
MFILHISDGKTITLWYNTSAWELCLRSESDFHREFKGKAYHASDVDTTLSGEIKQLLQEKDKKINLVLIKIYPTLHQRLKGEKG